MAEFAIIFISAIFVNNILLAQFLGVCPFLGVSSKVETAFGMGIAVTFVMALASLITYGINQLLVLWNLTYLQTITFILVIAALVQCVEMFLKKASPTLYSALGIYLPLITTNCAVLGVCLLNVDFTGSLGLVWSVLNGVFGAIGFLLAIVLMAGVRERMEDVDIPKSLKGFPLSLIIAGLMSIAFLGFSGLFSNLMS